MAATFRPRPSRWLEGTGWQEGDGRYARGTVRAGRRWCAHFVRVPGTSDVRDQLHFGMPAPASCSRARTGSRSFVRDAHTTTPIDVDVSCFPLRTLKGIRRIFQRSLSTIPTDLGKREGRRARALFNPVSRKFAISSPSLAKERRVRYGRRGT